MMIASDVPTQSCMRTASGTPNRRNSSNSTGTTTPPPPIPNTPARRPVTMPAAITATRSQASSAKEAPAGNYALTLPAPDGVGPWPLPRCGRVSIPAASPARGGCGSCPVFHERALVEFEAEAGCGRHLEEPVLWFGHRLPKVEEPRHVFDGEPVRHR